MRHSKQVMSEEDLFVGIDLHKIRWHVTIRTFEVELFSASIPGTWEALSRVLARYPGHPLQAVYEAGYFGFQLHDRLVARGLSCIVTPPSLIPLKYGNRV
jgi:transposase